MDVKVIAQMDNTIDHTFESANRIYDIESISPTIPTCSGGGIQPKILIKKSELKNVRKIVCSISLDASEGFSLTCKHYFKCVKANVHDLGVVIKTLEK